MTTRALVGRLSFALAVALISCAPPPAATDGASAVARPQENKRLTAAIFSDPAGMHLYLTNPGGSGSVPGVAEINLMLNAGLTQPDDLDVLQPRLAEAVPSAENGLWKVFPDGRMESTWHLRPDIAWYDGTPVRAEDLVFSAKVSADEQIGIVNPAALDLIEGVEAADPSTVVVKWKVPFIEADSMFIRSYHSSSAARPETRFQGTNRARYQNPALDALIERYVSTIPSAERLGILGDIIHHQTDQLTMLPLYFEGSSSVLGSTRVRGVTGDGTWNAHLWSVE